MLRSIMLLLVLFILGCATTVTRTDGERPIQCTITSAATFKIGDSVVITWALVNNTDKAMYFLDWATPFDTIRGMLTGKSFLVLRNGEPVTYTGTLVRRNGPSERDYYMVASGSSASIGIDLAKSYDMGDPGEYEITYIRGISDIIVFGESPIPRPKGSHRQRLELESNCLTINMLNSK